MSSQPWNRKRVPGGIRKHRCGAPRRTMPVTQGAQLWPWRKEESQGTQAAYGATRVPTARDARRWATVWAIAGTGGNNQFVSPSQGTEKASTHAAAGWKNREQNRPV